MADELCRQGDGRKGDLLAIDFGYATRSGCTVGVAMPPSVEQRLRIPLPMTAKKTANGADDRGLKQTCAYSPSLAIERGRTTIDTDGH